jgi:hypothetical protein
MLEWLPDLSPALFIRLVNLNVCSLPNRSGERSFSRRASELSFLVLLSEPGPLKITP